MFVRAVQEEYGYGELLYTDRKARTALAVSVCGILD